MTVPYARKKTHFTTPAIKLIFLGTRIQIVILTMHIRPTLLLPLCHKNCFICVHHLNETSSRVTYLLTRRQQDTIKTQYDNYTIQKPFNRKKPKIKQTHQQTAHHSPFAAANHTTQHGTNKPSVQCLVLRSTQQSNSTSQPTSTYTQD